MPEKILAIKVDVDTFEGTRDGIPALLEIMGRHRIKGTFYFSMGPDHTGKVLRRIFTHRGFLKKALRSGAPSAYSLKTMMYGVLLPGPVIYKKCQSIMREVESHGHEVGTHAWNHVDWHDFLAKSDMAFAKSELGQAAKAFMEVFGRLSATTAAPGWTISANSLELQDQMQLSYCSDSRGTVPFYPVLNDRRFSTLQIPTTLPTADELIGRNGITADALPDLYMNLLKPGLNVLTIHTELEGGIIRSSFDSLLGRLSDAGIRLLTLEEAREDVKHAPACGISMGMIEGRSLPVAIQGEEVPA